MQGILSLKDCQAGSKTSNSSWIKFSLLAPMSRFLRFDLSVNDGVAALRSTFILNNNIIHTVSLLLNEVQLHFSQQINFYHQIHKVLIQQWMQNIQPNNPGFSSNNPKSDYEFFTSLKNYQPLFYSGKGVPLLMTNDNWHQSLICMGFMDVLYIIALVFFIIRNGKNDDPTYKGYSGLSTTTMLIVSVLILLFANLSVILTQLFNPGIVNPSSITDSQYVKSGGKKWCIICNAYVCQDMEHCRQCHVCIWGLDHHCGYFNKCIGGYQKFLFYCALTFGFLGFINILLLLSSLIL